MRVRDENDLRKEIVVCNWGKKVWGGVECERLEGSYREVKREKCFI